MSEEERSLTVMTYNVHRCIGTDRHTSPARIAEVIASFDPDLVALQELSGGRFRPDCADTARELTAELMRLFAERPFLFMERERCGNAILSRYPIRLVRAGGLHSEKRRRALVPRGALWVELTFAGRAVQVINTHLGLTPPERTSQVRVLMGAEWMGHPTCRPPIILCGDFNIVPNSAVHKRLKGSLDALRSGEELQEIVDPRIDTRKREHTFPSRRPLVRLDHLFVSPDIEVQELRVPQNHLTRIASDHLPLIAELKLV